MMLSLLALLAGCDALFGLSTVTYTPPADAGPDAPPRAVSARAASKRSAFHCRR